MTDETERLSYVPQLDVDGTPYVQFMWRDQEAAFAPQAARRAALALLEAAEQADLEHEMWEWLMTDAASGGVPVDERRAQVAKIIATFRQHREHPAPFTPIEETQ